MNDSFSTCVCTINEHTSSLYSAIREDISKEFDISNLILSKANQLHELIQENIDPLLGSILNVDFFNQTLSNLLTL
jgi:hypothetical protein